jgi:hypothetical protein
MYQPYWQCCTGGCNESVWGSGCWGAGNEMVADVWHLTELLYRVAPTHLEGQGHVHTNRPQTHFVCMKHGNKFLMSRSK